MVELTAVGPTQVKLKILDEILVITILKFRWTVDR